MRRIVLLFMSMLLLSSPLWAQVQGLSGWNIVLDPGHSQKENMGIYNYSEAEKNVRVALALREYLLTSTDIDTVYLTRTNDNVQVSLSQRTDYANSLGAAWYHSIHSDAGSPDANSTLLLWGQYRTGQEKVPKGGQAMSAIIVDLLTQGMRTTSRGSYGDCTFYGCTTAGPYLHVNRTTTMPSELSEAGFHTSPLQNQRNMNAEWKKLEAWTFYWSFLKFFGLERPSVGILTGFVQDVDNGELVNGASITVNGQTYTTDTYASLFHKYSSNPEQLHNGFYYFDGLPDSTMTVYAEAPGYYSDTLTVSMKSDFFTFLDIQLVSQRPPVVASSSPQQGADRFPAWSPVTIVFSRSVLPASVEAAFSLLPEAPGVFTWSDNNRKLVFRPDTLQFAADYTLTIDSTVVDAYGHRFDGDG